MWPKRHKAPKPIQQDVGEARSLRKEARAEMQEVERKDPYVSGLAARLIERRDLNGFGDQIQITYTRRSA